MHTVLMFFKPAFNHHSKALYVIYETLLCKATYSVFRLYIVFVGIEPTTFYTTNAML